VFFFGRVESGMGIAMKWRGARVGIFPLNRSDRVVAAKRYVMMNSARRSIKWD
jgi:hypothetical protein